jgi:hypothetical protein
VKPIYILDYYNDSSVRRQRASLAEIRAVVEGRSTDRLAYVAIGDDGDIAATPLTAAEIEAIRSELTIEHRRLVRDVLDHAATLARKIRPLDGFSAGSFGAVTIWLESAPPGTDDIVLAWAEAHEAEIRRSSPPADRKHWWPDAEIKLDGVDICRMVWPERECNTDAAIEQEIASVTAERATAARELEVF